MEKFKTIIFNKIHNLFAERLIVSDPIAYATKWDSLRTFMDTVLQNLKSFFSEFFASSSERQALLEKKLSSVVAKQEKMNVNLQTIVATQDEMGFDLKTIMELLRQKA